VNSYKNLEGQWILGLPNLEHEGTTVPQNAGIYLLTNTAQHPRRLDCSKTVL
jgi:hypothetical protein